MPKNCVAANCKNTSTNTDASFHKFPKNEKQRAEWVRQVKRTRAHWEGPTNDFSHVCSDHFTEDCYEKGPKIKADLGWNVKCQRVLQKNAVPTIFPRPGTGPSKAKQPRMSKAYEKRERFRIINELLNEYEEKQSARNNTDDTELTTLEAKTTLETDTWPTTSEAANQFTTLQPESKTLHAQATTLQAETSTLQAEFASLQAWPTTLQAEPTTLQAEPTTLEAEPTTLQAESTTLLAESTTLQADFATLEAQNEPAILETACQTVHVTKKKSVKNTRNRNIPGVVKGEKRKSIQTEKVSTMHPFSPVCVRQRENVDSLFSPASGTITDMSLFEPSADGRDHNTVHFRRQQIHNTSPIEEETNARVSSEPTFIAFWSCFKTLLTWVCCPMCHSHAVQVFPCAVGLGSASLLRVKILCESCGKITIWKSQP